MHNLKVLEDLMIRPNMNFPMVACGLFVFISGATIALNKKEEGLTDFYKKRLSRVLIPFYIAYIIYFIIKVISYRTLFIFDGVPKWRFIFTILGVDEYLSANGIRTFSLGVGEWFLGCIILCYIVFPILYKANKSHKILTFIVMTIYYLFINYNYSRFNFVIASHMNFLCQIYNFYLGIACIDKAVISKIKKWLLFITIPLIIFFYAYDKVLLVPDNIKTTIVVLSIYATFYNIEDLISKTDIITHFIKLFNKISLEIFLVHHFVIYQVDFILNYRRLSGLETLAVIFVDFVLTIALAIIVNRLSSKAYSSMNKCWNK